jgi:lactoylglutathione lyase
MLFRMPSFEIKAVNHIGIRVLDSARSEAFYRKLGFEVVWRGGPDPVVILRNAPGVEINLIVNADPALDGKNVLMDPGAAKAAGYTHVALSVDSIESTIEFLRTSGIELSGGPMQLGEGVSLFVRDPDRNVIELRQSPATLPQPLAQA